MRTAHPKPARVSLGGSRLRTVDLTPRAWRPDSRKGEAARETRTFQRKTAKQALWCSTKEPKASGGCNHRKPRQRRAPPPLGGAAVKTGDPLLGEKKKPLLPVGPPWWRKGQETTCQRISLGSMPGRSPREGIQSSILAWRMPRAEEPGGLQSKGSQGAGHG